MSMLRRLTAAAILLLLLALPASASAALTYTVNVPGDQPDAVAGGDCDVDTTAAGPQCTLRAALQLANANPSGFGDADVVAFDGAAMQAAGGRTITVTNTDGGHGSLPPIADQVTVDASTACAGTGQAAPCVEVRLADGAGSTFTVTNEASFVTKLRGLRLTNASTAVGIPDAVSGIQIEDSAFGTKLDGTVDPVAVGVLSGGDIVEVRRSSFAGGQAGVVIVGGNGNGLYGNRFGFAHDTTTPTDASRLAFGVVVAGGSSPANANIIGGDDSSGTPACDAACNLFAASRSATGSAIRLGPLPGETGQGPPESTTIAGNFVGVPASGTTCAAGGKGTGIDVAASKDTTIGDGDVGAGNFLGCVGGPNVESGASSTGLTVAYSHIGVMPDRATPAPLATAGAPSLRLAGAGKVELSTIGGPGPGGDALEVSGPADVYSNDIGRSGTGTDLAVDGAGVRVTGGTGAVVRHNVIQRVGGAGIHLTGGTGATILANDIGGTEPGEGAGADGILIAGATSAKIGDEADASSPNHIFGSAGDAIRIAGDGTDGNTIFDNDGSGNGGLFVDLGADGPGNDPATGSNSGILGPSVLATATGASGKATKDGTVRVFRTTGPGQLGAQIGEVEVADDGAWSVTFAAALANGDLVAATQTDTTGNTSELTTATVGGPLVQPARTPPADTDEDGDGGAGGGAGNGGGGGGGGDTAQQPAPPQQPPAITGEPLVPQPDRAGAATRNLRRIVSALRRARLRGLVRRGRVAILGVEMTGPGVLRLKATTVVPRARAAGAARVTVLTATVRFTAAGAKRVTVRVTKAGRRVVRRARRLPLRLRLTTTEPGLPPIVAQQSVTLKR